jgi:hypothetical protein
MLATCFATPTFLFADPVLSAAAAQRQGCKALRYR